MCESLSVPILFKQGITFYSLFAQTEPVPRLTYFYKGVLITGFRTIVY